MLHETAPDIMRFRNWIVAVTGGARGIGAATAGRFAAEGATVEVADLESPTPVDVTSRDQVRSFFDNIASKHGRLDTLVCNAGRPWSSTTLEATEDAWRDCLALNLESAWLCARAAHPLLLASDRASIVNVASAQGQRANRRSFPYSAAKGGLLALTRSMAVEYAPRIRVNAIIPGQIESVRTEPYFNSFSDPAEARRRVLSTFPMGRLGKPEDIAGAIAFLASTDAAWITGTFFYVDGGRDASMVDLSDLEDRP